NASDAVQQVLQARQLQNQAAVGVVGAAVRVAPVPVGAPVAVAVPAPAPVAAPPQRQVAPPPAVAPQMVAADAEVKTWVPGQPSPAGKPLVPALKIPDGATQQEKDALIRAQGEKWQTALKTEFAIREAQRPPEDKGVQDDAL